MAILLIIVYQFLTTLFDKVSQRYQWILALFSPLPRELFVWLLLKLASKALGDYDMGTKLTIIHFVSLKHALALITVLGSVSTTETTYIILGIDFLINIYTSLKIVYLVKFSKKENSGREGKFH